MTSPLHGVYDRLPHRRELYEQYHRGDYDQDVTIERRAVIEG
ncbi:hypothetical protein [Haloarcula sp. 1CSR25-25]|nr:hypothetical protein [Haloarcula sp. 1CSR25-25]